MVQPALPCPALPCPALPCPALPCPALPCPALLPATPQASALPLLQCSPHPPSGCPPLGRRSPLPSINGAHRPPTPGLHPRLKPGYFSRARHAASTAGRMFLEGSQPP
jgi:hypothetical protein